MKNFFGAPDFRNHKSTPGNNVGRTFVKITWKWGQQEKLWLELFTQNIHNRRGNIIKAGL